MELNGDYLENKEKYLQIFCFLFVRLSDLKAGQISYSFNYQSYLPKKTGCSSSKPSTASGY